MKTKTAPPSNRQPRTRQAPAPADAPARSLLAWTDFETVLAVARAGSVARATETLAMSHVTLLRKLDAIESRLKARLFERERGRYTPTAAGETVIEAASAMAPLARGAELRVIGQDLRPSGHVRVAVAGVVIDHLLPPVLSQFANAFPDVTLELVASRDHASLARREADVAIRISDSVPDWLVGRRLGTIAFRVYALRRPGIRVARRSVEALLSQRRWIAFEQFARDLKFDRWLDKQVPDSSIALRVDGFSHALTMVRAGLGIAILPTFVERSCPDLQPLTDTIAELETPLWVLTHRELRHTMRIKVLMQAIGPAVSHMLET
jgi:DNA-binding transcriptional LysR family regulator